MSAMQDLKKTWGDKFGSELPASSFWVEDVKNNLEKHKARVEELKKSLKEEEDYVQFLQILLEEITGNKSSDGANSISNVRSDQLERSNIDDVIKDTLHRRCQSGNAKSVRASSTEQLATEPIETENKKEIKDAVSQNKANSEVTNGNTVPPPQVSRSVSQEQPDESDHFVTVIEVNGQDKEKKNASAIPAELEEKRKPIPPIPPPKNIKRGSNAVSEYRYTHSEIPTPPATRLPFSSFGHGLDTTSRPHETVESKLRFVEDKNCVEWLGERNVVFDSNKNKTQAQRNTGNSSGSTLGLSELVVLPTPTNPSLSSSKESKEASAVIKKSVEESTKSDLVFLKPLPKKKFEGSKLPLPPSEKTNSSQVRKTTVPNSLELNMSSPQQDRRNVSRRSKISDMIGKLEGGQNKNENLTPKRSFREHSSSRKNSETLISHSDLMAEYMDPCDAEGMLLAEEIYDCPPDSPASIKSVEKQPEVEAVTSQGPVELELEPMYDTVAPDQENDDDYVVLLEEEEKTVGSSNSVKGGSLSRKRKDSKNELKSESATIRSQTSIFSGHSITTTSSGTTSDTECFTESPVPEECFPNGRTPSSNYVNIEYFLCQATRHDSHVSESDAESDAEPSLHRGGSYERNRPPIKPKNGNFPSENDDAGKVSNGTKSSNISKENAPTMRVADQVKLRSYQTCISTMATSENQYVEVLNLMLQYMKAMKATFSTSKPVLTTDDFNIIFYKIPELYSMHHKFLVGLQDEISKGRGEVGKHFQTLALEVDIYGSFLQNYSRAVDTVKKCSQSNAAFADTTRDMRSRILNINAGVTLETLLHSPVSRVQKNLELVKDLMKLLPDGHPDTASLSSSLKLFQSFLTEFKMIQPEHLSDKTARVLVKNSFIVELSEGTRKLRHLFLFNDVLVCAKYKATRKSDKFTYELKWYMAVADCLVVDELNEPRESAPINLVSLRSKASNVRDQIKRQTSREEKKQKTDKQKKKLAELEGQLVLASPNLIFKLKSSNGKSAGTFFLSSEYDRSQWIDTIDTLKKQSSQLPATSQLSSNDLQQWITKHRKDLKTNMGSYLMSGRDENLLLGDFYILIGQLAGIQRPADLYICLELDSYGHFFRKAKTKMICGSSQPNWSEDFIIELEGALNLRVLLYEEHPTQGQLIRATTTIELNRAWIKDSVAKCVERTVNLQDFVLKVSTKFTPSEMTIRRVPAAKAGGLFGAKITQVCKREKRQVPFIITTCIREVERRGMNEMGIYRVSGSASDVARLKKAFESDSYEAEQLLKEVEISSVASLLKLYLRELPEALFTDDFYPRFFDAFNQNETELKKSHLLQVFKMLPPLNQHIIMFLLDHMIRINEHENHNKMSIHNISTIFGPTLLRPGTKTTGNNAADSLAAGTTDVLAQVGILYFFLSIRANKESFLAVLSSNI